MTPVGVSGSRGELSLQRGSSSWGSVGKRGQVHHRRPSSHTLINCLEMDLGAPGRKATFGTLERITRDAKSETQGRGSQSHQDRVCPRTPARCPPGTACPGRRGQAQWPGTPKPQVWPTSACLVLEGAGEGGERGCGRQRRRERVGGGADVRPGPGSRRPLPCHILVAALAAGPGRAPRSRAASRAATGERAGVMQQP